MPTKAPAEPMMASQPWRMPASTATLTAALPMIAARLSSGSGQQQLEARHRDDARRDFALGEQLLRRDRDGDFRAGGEQRHDGVVVVGGDQFIGAGAQRLCSSKPWRSCGRFCRVSASTLGRVLALAAPAASTRRSRPRRRAEHFEIREWRAAPRDARPADGSGRLRRARSKSWVITWMTRWPISAASRIAGRQ